MVDNVEQHHNQEIEQPNPHPDNLIQPASKEPLPPKDTEGFIEQTEKAGEKTGPVPTDDQGQPLVQHTPQPTDDTLPDDAVILPMTQTEFEQGLHAPLIKGARWLAEWCSYTIKKLGDKVFFRG